MEGKLLPDARREQIIGLIHTNGVMRVSDIAHKLGVAPITVRRDIHDLAEQGLIERIRGGARPLPKTRHDSSSADITIAMVVPSLDYFWPHIIRGANDGAAELDIKLVLHQTTFQAKDQLILLRKLVQEPNTSGIIFAPDIEGVGSEELKGFLQTVDIPIVLIERVIRPEGRFPAFIESVSTRHVDGGQIAVRHLAALDHRRIALVTDKAIPSRHGITTGWRTALDELGLDTDSPLCDTSSLTGDERLDCLKDFIDSCLQGERVTAIIAHSDEVALHIIQSLTERGLSVPHDMSLISYDDELATLAHPPLTAIAPPKYSLGFWAVRSLARRIRQPECPKNEIRFEPHLVVRESTCPPQ